MPQALAQAQRVAALIQNRNGASLQDLRRELSQLIDDVAAILPLLEWPEDVERPLYPQMMPLITTQWSELGFYEEETGFPALGIAEADKNVVGWAADDLADIACEVVHALRLSAIRQSYGMNWLRFSHEIHWGQHASDLLRYLAHFPTQITSR